MLYELKLHQGELDLGDDVVIVAHGEDDELCPCGRQFDKHCLEVYLIEADQGYQIKGLSAPESFGPARMPGFYHDDMSDSTVVVSSIGKWVFEPNNWYGIEDDYDDYDSLDFDDEP